MKNLFKPKKDDKKEKPEKTKDSKSMENFEGQEIIQDWDIYNTQTPNASIPPKKYYPQNNSSQIRTPFVYQPTYNKRLTIVLIENTNEVAKENEKLIKIIKKFVNSSNLVSIIRYGSQIEKIKICEFDKLKDEDFCCNNDIGENACLYDTLIEMKKFISEKLMKVEEINSKKYKIIGIGRCIDTCSINSKEFGISEFSNISKLPTILSKYFCLTEEFFLNAAEVGFRSIGSISRTYQ